MEKNIMARIVRKDYSCPDCGHGRFIVTEIQHNIFFTNNYGEIIDSAEGYNPDKCVAHCCNCHHNFKAISTPVGFIPVTNLSYLIYNNTVQPNINENKVMKPEDYNNPMALQEFKEEVDNNEN